MQDERFRLPQSSNGSSSRDHEAQCNPTPSDFPPSPARNLRMILFAGAGKLPKFPR
jgi:hypothetical protein